MTKAKRATSKKRARDPIAGQLTAQQEAFCQHYALNQAGSEAFSVAFPERAKGKTPQYRAEQASKLLAQSKIKTRISALATRAIANAEKKFDISVDRVLQEFAAIAFYKADDYFEWGTIERAVYHKGEPVLDRNGEQVFENVPQLKIRDSKTLTAEQMRAVLAASMTISKTGDPVLEVKMADKVAALKALGQHLKMFNAGVDVKNMPGGNVQIIISSDEANL
ncbi:MAG TPA: terminase small subunit [Azonexus sp.]|nr:terminase small subunit [Azonexus sp.]